MSPRGKIVNVKEFSKLTGLSAHTLRYYEKIGLLKNINRNQSGHRVYSPKDTDWINFVIRLKDTGMPLQEILSYASMRSNGSETLVCRQQLLENHRLNLKSHIQKQQEHLEALEHKIQLYKSGKVS